MEINIKEAKPCPKCNSNNLEFMSGFCYGEFLIVCEDCNYMGGLSKGYEKCPEQSVRMEESLKLWNDEERK
jgi:hypothetical protein